MRVRVRRVVENVQRAFLLQPRGPKPRLSRDLEDKLALIRGKEEGRAVLEEGTASVPRS